MREIKFRVFFKGSLRPVISFNGSHVVIATSEYRDMRWGEVPLNECELMQYIGLKDKNGNEIYEGDVIEWPDNHREKVQWYEHFAGFCPSVWNTKVIEILGNIHENPELLK